jgi:hypothetical protein
LPEEEYSITQHFTPSQSIQSTSIPRVIVSRMSKKWSKKLLKKHIDELQPICTEIENKKRITKMKEIERNKTTAARQLMKKCWENGCHHKQRYAEEIARYSYDCEGKKMYNRGRRIIG